MNNIDMEAKAGKDLRMWSCVLLILALVGIAWSAYSIADAMFGTKLQLGLYTTSGLKGLTEKDFTFSQRLIVVGIVSLPALSWSFGLWQIARLSWMFYKGELFSNGIIGCVARFGWALLAMGLADAAIFPMLGWYLVSLKKIDPIENLGEAIIGSGMLDSLMAAVFVLIITRILRIAARIRDDAELTI